MRIYFYVVIIINLCANSINSLLLNNSGDFGYGFTNSETLSCYRPCKLHEKPRRCHFAFKVKPRISNDSKASIAINDNIPGPAINVCLNDIIIVELENSVPGQDLAIHWHGIEQVGTPSMDGVPMVTQCPVYYGSRYRYTFRPSKSGTYFYHAYSVAQQTDGVFGALNVNQPSPLKPQSSLYNYDRSLENTLLISAVFPKLFTGSLDDLSIIKPTDLEINGEANYKIFMMEGYSYRLRLINAVAIDCPIAVGVDEHDLTIIATDSSDVKPETVKKVLLYPGERMDVVVQATQQPGGYWVHVHGLEQCKGLQSRAAIVYYGVNYTSLVPDDQKRSESVTIEKGLLLSGQMLKALQDNSKNNSSVVSVYLIIDREINKFMETNNEFRYISDGMPRKPYYPVAMSSKGVVLINSKIFQYPNAPILIQPRDVSKEAICKVGLEENHVEPQCIHVLEASPNTVLDIVLINEGKYSNNSYTFHMHGHSMQVLASSKANFERDFSKEDFLKMDESGLISRNLVNPALKDTITVPNKGYTIARLKLDNPGSWMLECRSCSLSSLPTAILISVKRNMPQRLTSSLPKCGNYRPPDVLLN